MKKIIIAGIGPGSKEDITPAVLEAVREADVVVGYKYYFQFIDMYVKAGCECIDTGMKKERERAEQAFLLAEHGKTVVVISSGDAGLYGMAPLVYEMKRERGSDVEIEALPGISAFQKAASLLGAPIGHDTCLISLSDLMTPWEVIERRIKAAAVGDFVTAVYNPKSHGRYWQLYRLQELFLQERAAETPVGYVRQAGREEQEAKVTVDRATITCMMGGDTQVALGTTFGPAADVLIRHSNARLDVQANNSAVVGAWNGRTEFRIDTAMVRMEARGKNVFAFGGNTEDTDAEFLDGDLRIRLRNNSGKDTLASADRVRMINGRQEIEVNGTQIERAVEIRDY